MRARLGVITGLGAEARIIEKAARRGGVSDSIVVRRTGARAARARAHAAVMVENGTDGLLSFGVAGALDPSLSPGDLILATAIRTVDGAIRPCATAWRARLAARLGSVAVHEGEILGSNVLVDDPESKVRLFRSSGALALDMESLAVAEIAGRSDVSFLAVRAIADPASRAPPSRSLELITENGEVRVGAAFAALAARPGLIPHFAGLAGDTRAALRTLRRVAALGGPLFALV